MNRRISFRVRQCLSAMSTLPGAQDCADRYDKTDQHERHGHGDEYGQRAVGVLQEIQVYFVHNFPFVSLSILTRCGKNNREKSSQTMRRLLRPASPEQQAEIARQLTTPGNCEQQTLADAGLEDEVRGLLSRRKSRGGESLP